MRLLLIFLVAWLLGTCRSAAPEVPRDFEWVTWSNAAAGYALEVPDVYRAVVEDEGRTLLFRWSGTVSPARLADRHQREKGRPSRSAPFASRCTRR